MPIKFIANHNTIIFGASSVGKTTFMLRVIKEKLIEPFAKHIFYMYKIKQPFMDTWNDGENPLIHFIEGLNFEPLKMLNEPSILVVDDLILSTCKEMAEMFILGSHHRQISTFFITQNLFPRDKLFRTMSSNSHYFVLFNCQRNYRQIVTLARQAFTGDDVFRVINAYKRASNNPRGFILLTFTPLLPKQLCVITDFWETCPSIYL